MNFDDLYSWMIKLGVFAISVAVVDIGGRSLRKYFINKGRKEAFEEMEAQGFGDDIYITREEDGERAILCVNGKKFYLNLEPVVD